MFERFTDHARKSISIANLKAIEKRHGYIGTEHILLGIILSGNCMANNVLTSLATDPQLVRSEVERLLIDGTDASCGKLPMTASAKRALEHAIAEAAAMQHNYVGTEHLLLGLMHDQTRIAGTVLKSLGLTPEAVRKSIVEILGDAPDEPDPPLPAACGLVVSAYGEHSLSPPMASRSWATELTVGEIINFTPRTGSSRAVDNLSRYRKQVNEK